ncbi:MAG: GIY-YIG nuclease family protein [Candidatus Giovannonibacteria bacterium]|nr:MAG: GIY-YIG nuclease family protein [Candidatus Giovannonibacteria bacterium]
MLTRKGFKKAPNAPGIYFFRDKGGKILYIGKAANLRARIRSYFGKAAKPPLGGLAAKLNLSWEVLGSETEALIREAELIKKHLPKYNVLMRDDKQYFYVGFTKEKFPKIFITHQQNREANYIGPFTEGGALRSVLKTLRRAFPYCTCKKSHPRPCLNARIGRCLGFCCLPPHSPPYQGGDQGEVYKNNIRAIKKILSGNNKSLAFTLKKEMHKLSDARKYEEAGKIRDQIRALEKIFEHRGVIKQDLPTEYQKALRALESILGVSGINPHTKKFGVGVNRIESYDIANIHGRFAYGSMAVFANGKIQKNAYRLFKIKTVKESNDPAMLKEVLERRLKHREWPYPEIILVDGGKSQLSAALKAIPPLAPPYKGGDKKNKLPSLRRRGLGEVIKFIALTKNKKHVGDHIFISGKASPISLARLPEPLKNFILMLDSEAHRFAISHYRKLHRKSLTFKT